MDKVRYFVRMNGVQVGTSNDTVGGAVIRAKWVAKKYRQAIEVVQAHRYGYDNDFKPLMPTDAVIVCKVDSQGDRTIVEPLTGIADAVMGASLMSGRERR